ncbi:hypothetical protein A2W24_03510 [Microgenomates group bacterium RBG_16_45_19]|nr:MAG: hypothetical protein A2W24_03510 [Microgenomates group bacterium RBG_16_45_19]
MATIKQLTNEIEDMGTFGDLTRVYGEVALTRMNRVRAEVLANRRFLEQLKGVFAQVQAAYLKQLAVKAGANRRTPKQERISVLQHNGMTVMVLLSANMRLYGDILRRTFATFMQAVHQERCEATIVGKVGLTMFKEEMGLAPVTYFDFPDDRVDRKLLGEIINHLVQYERVVIWYPRFRNVIKQEPVELSISAQQPMGQVAPTLTQAFHFEPSLEAVMAFFEREIFATFLEQTIREAQLSKFAARAMSMDRAQETISNKKQQLVSKRRLVVKEINNKRQVNLMPAYL